MSYYLQIDKPRLNTDCPNTKNNPSDKHATTHNTSPVITGAYLPRATRSATNFLWSTFTRFDPASDITAKEVKLQSAHASYTPPVVIDARMKGYPEELFCDEETAALVDEDCLATLKEDNRRWCYSIFLREVLLHSKKRHTSCVRAGAT